MILTSSVRLFGQTDIQTDGQIAALKGRTILGIPGYWLFCIVEWKRLNQGNPTHNVYLACSYSEREALVSHTRPGNDEKDSVTKEDVSVSHNVYCLLSVVVLRKLTVKRRSLARGKTHEKLKY